MTTTTPDRDNENATAPIVFLDTETTGLQPDADIWELAAIRREPDGTETHWHMFIEHDPAKCQLLPDDFRADHTKRYRAEQALHPALAARYLAEEIMIGRPHVAGAVPNFDTERMSRLLEAHGHPREPWHYHLIDAENLAVGYLHGRATPIVLPREEFGLPYPPWDSDELSRAVGVDPPSEMGTSAQARHTAMGDALWAMRLYDAITGGASPQVTP